MVNNMHTDKDKKKKQKTYTQKLLFTRKAERIASFARILLLVGNGFLIAKLLLDILGAKSVLKTIYIVILAFVEIALYFSQKYLDKIRKENDFEIDNFEDTAKYKKKRTRPDGQINENGEMNVNILLKRGSDYPFEDLDKLIGLTTVKVEVRNLQALLQYESKANIDTSKNVCRHYAFLGNPGTGKTTVARIFAGILYQNGRIPKNKYLECTGNDLTGEYAGQTKNKVNAIYEKAKGGVLFIDEAYALCRKGNDSIAEEAVSQLLVHMEADPYTVFIFAGYTNEMINFMNMNPGLASRVSRQIVFPDYTPEELVQIFTKFSLDKGLRISSDGHLKLRELFEAKLAQKDSKYAFSNGRYARNCFDYIYQQHAVNCVNLDPTNPQMMYINEKDITDIWEMLLTLS